MFGYFGMRRWPLRMPKAADVLGIRYTGPVLTGRMSVEVAQGMEAGKAAAARPGERYETPGDYDPVLRAHCGMDRIISRKAR